MLDVSVRPLPTRGTRGTPLRPLPRVKKTLILEVSCQNLCSCELHGVFIIGKWVWHLAHLLFLHNEEGLMLVGEWLEFVVNNLQRITDDVVLLLERAERGKDGVIYALNQDDFLKWVYLDRFLVFIGSYDYTLFLLLLFLQYLILQVVFTIWNCFLEICKKLGIQTDRIFDCILV